MKKEAAIIALALLLACAPIESVNRPVSPSEESLHVEQLDNGLTITIKEAHSLPLVSIQFWVHVGSKNEPEQYRGIAHIFEHIWFKGTEKQPVGSFHKKVEDLGGELNAMTSHDWTMYYVTVPSDKFDDIFPLMVDLLQNPKFDEKEIEKEKQVVLEEQRFSENEPEKYLDDRFAQLLIQKHPYRHPIIGYKKTILAPSREEIMKFYNTWYVPNNMNIVIVGDVNPDETLQKVEEAFDVMKPKPLPKQERPEEDPAREPRYNSTTRDVGYTYIAIGYLAPKAQEKDRYAMEVLNA
ncbi:insulinase family protein, partial [Candidatus Woesearchaeota archaeon]